MTAKALSATVSGRESTIPAHLEKLVETAKDYARGAKAAATLRAYGADWRHYTTWCARKGIEPLPPEPQIVGLYLAACASEKWYLAHAPGGSPS